MLYDITNFLIEKNTTLCFTIYLLELLLALFNIKAILVNSYNIAYIGTCIYMIFKIGMTIRILLSELHSYEIICCIYTLQLCSIFVYVTHLNIVIFVNIMVMFNITNFFHEISSCLCSLTKYKRYSCFAFYLVRIVGFFYICGFEFLFLDDYVSFGIRVLIGITVLEFNTVFIFKF